jgi:2-polyprenyl-3-methyl-5-hydroxy-6-metoxy-1,4-benzoquinol methylase
MKEQWNARYSIEEYNYGKEPNNFLKEELPRLKPGKILFLGEGEGRNAVYAATLGWNVDAIDFSEEGKRKAEKLASESRVNINYLIADFSTFIPEENSYDAVGIFFIHLEEELCANLFQRAIISLKPSGKIIFECFEKEQINYTSGGPKEDELLYSLEDVVNLFIDLDFEKLTKEKIFLSEGKLHFGDGMVIRFIGTRKYFF